MVDYIIYNSISIFEIPYDTPELLLINASACGKYWFAPKTAWLPHPLYHHYSNGIVILTNGHWCGLQFKEHNEIITYLCGEWLFLAAGCSSCLFLSYRGRVARRDHRFKADIYHSQILMFIANGNIPWGMIKKSQCYILTSSGTALNRKVIYKGIDTHITCHNYLWWYCIKVWMFSCPLHNTKHKLFHLT